MIFSVILYLPPGVPWPSFPVATNDHPISRPPRLTNAFCSVRLIVTATFPGPPSSYHWYITCSAFCGGRAGPDGAAQDTRITAEPRLRSPADNAGSVRMGWDVN